jgi:hypothetical protein
MSYRLHTAAIAAFAAVALLAGCSAAPAEITAETVESPETVETSTPEPEVVEPVFSMPTACADILPASRITAIESQGNVLLGGPGGRYETDYLLEPSPEERLGGITCIWGFSDSEVSSITVSVAPLPPANRAPVVESFVSEGLNQSEINGATVFAQQGDTQTQPAIINSLRADSWISVIATIGGTAFFEEALEILAEATDTAYVIP